MLKYKKLTLKVPEEAKSLVSDFLLGLEDVTGTAEDIIEGEGFEVSAYFPLKTDLSPTIKSLRNYLKFLEKNLPGFHSGSIKVEGIDLSSWVLWKRELKIVKASRRVIIRPPWEEYSPKEDELVIEINPSMAFGTGHHETTRLCIRAMEEIFEKVNVKSVLDVGCGSGILSIVAVKLGVDKAVGLDIDPVAVMEAKKNSERNSVSDKIKLICGYIEAVKGRFDLIVANISVETIILMRDELRLRLNGNLLVSGIPISRRDEVVSGLEKDGFILERELREGDWVAIVFSVDKNSI
ncbi:MAG: 50S ribosomal protein L11 methyltransferase [Candidatus Dadabacteria bacterium]